MGNSSIIMYTTEDGLTKIETTFDEDTVWLSLEQMAELFQRDKSTISRHIKTYLKKVNYKEIQLLQILQQLPLTENISGRLHAVFSSRSSFCFISACLSLS